MIRVKTKVAAALFILSSCLFTNSASAAYSPSVGDLIKVNGLGSAHGEVYYIDSNLKRELFVNRVVYNSWYSDFSKLKIIPQTDFEALQLGSNVTAKAGSIIKFENSDVVYSVSPGRNISAITPADAQEQFGSNWQNKLLIVQSSFENDYTKNSESSVVYVPPVVTPPVVTPPAVISPVVAPPVVTSPLITPPVVSSTPVIIPPISSSTIPTAKSIVINKNSALVDQVTALPNTLAPVKIGSFVLHNYDNAFALNVSSIKIQLNQSPSNYSSFGSSLYISLSPNDKKAPQASNDFSVTESIPSESYAVVDVYMNVGSVPASELGKTIVTSLSVTAIGANGADASVPVSSAVTGQTLTVYQSSIITVTTNSAAAAGNVSGNTTLSNAANYNIKVANGPIILDQLTFTVNGSGNPITNLTVVPNGLTQNWAAPIFNGYGQTAASFFTIPVDSVGRDFAVSADFAAYSLPATASISLTGVKWHMPGGDYITTSFSSSAYQSATFTVVP